MKERRGYPCKRKTPWEARNDRLLYYYMFAWSFAFLLAVPIAAYVSGEGLAVFSDFLCILTAPSKLVTDYFGVGGLGATLLNAALCGLSCNLLLLFSGVDHNARVLAGYILVVAHCFYGLNFLNMWPPFFGVLIFSLVTHRRFSEQIHIALFATSLGPFISDFVFRYPLGDAYDPHRVQVSWLGVGLALVFGIFAGFVIPGLLEGTTRMHRGFNLYKAGLAIGLLGTFAYAFLYRTLGVEEPPALSWENPVYESHGFSHEGFMTGFFLFLFLGSILAGFLLNGRSFRGYRNLFFSTGHDVDFSERYGAPLCFVNFGVLGLCILSYMKIVILLSDGVGHTGPTVGVIIAALTFAAAGQTPRNVLPIAIGYSLLYTVSWGITTLADIPMTWTLSSQEYINGLAFATGLCPFSGRYGWKVGTAAGFVDAIICTSTAAMHGGFVLYNGGFAAGLTALILMPILDYYRVAVRYPHEPPSLASDLGDLEDIDLDTEA